MKNTIKNTMLGISILLSMCLSLLAEANSEGTGTHERTQKCLYNATVLGASRVEPNGKETSFDVDSINLGIAVRLNDVAEEEGVLSCADYVGDMKLIQIQIDPSLEWRFHDLYRQGGSIKISFESRWSFEFSFETWTIVE